MYDGLLLGVLTWLSFVISFMHFPLFIKKLLLKNFFITDMMSVITSFLLLTSISKSLVAVIASMFCGLLVNVTLVGYEKYKKTYF
jgi:hypothetical protein